MLPRTRGREEPRACKPVPAPKSSTGRPGSASRRTRVDQEPLVVLAPTPSPRGSRRRWAVPGARRRTTGVARPEGPPDRGERAAAPPGPRPRRAPAVPTMPMPVRAPELAHRAELPQAEVAQVVAAVVLAGVAVLDRVPGHGSDQLVLPDDRRAGQWLGVEVVADSGTGGVSSCCVCVETTTAGSETRKPAANRTTTIPARRRVVIHGPTIATASTTAGSSSRGPQLHPPCQANHVAVSTNVIAT